MKVEYILIGVVAIIVLVVGLQAYQMFFLSNKMQPVTQPIIQSSNIKLPANIQSSAPINFKNFEEEVDYYKRNAKNPNNINIEKAVRNMDKNLDGQCDKCGMAILHCIESGMENM